MQCDLSSKMMSKKSFKASKILQPTSKLSYCVRTGIRSVLTDTSVEWDWKGEEMFSLKDHDAHHDHCGDSFTSPNSNPSFGVLTDADTDISFPL